MDTASVVTCRRENANSSPRCDCGAAETTSNRYDVVEATCIASCRDGRYFETNTSAFPAVAERSWILQHTDDESFSGTYGICLECEAGSFSAGSVDFVTRCEACAPGRKQTSRGQSACVRCESGRYAAATGSITCDVCEAGFLPEMTLGSASCVPLPAGQYAGGVACPENTYSEGAAVACVDCPFGKISQVGSSDCAECDLFFRLSKRCDIPVAGALAILVVLSIAGVVGCLGYRVYMGQRKRATRLASEVERHVELSNMQRQLLKAKSRDIELLASAWRIDERDVQFRERIASGSFGEVYRGTLKRRYDVAVKVMFDVDDDIDNDEINFLRRCRHPRLVMFLGCGKRESGDVFVVLEYCSKGTLADLLFKSKRAPAWSLRVSLFVDIAEAMTFLHFTRQSIHRDLKPQNVLLEDEDGELRCKVADFNLSKCFGQDVDASVAVAIDAGQAANGTSIKSATTGTTTSSSGSSSFVSSRNSSAITTTETTRTGSRSKSSTGGAPLNKNAALFSLSSNADSSSQGVICNSSENSNSSTKSNSSDIDRSMTTMVGTPSYIAPEIYAGQRYSQKVDVYSFGLMMWAGLALRTPHEDLNFVYKIKRAVLNGDRPIVSPASARDAPDGYVPLMRECWAQDPIERPAFNAIYDRLVRVRVSCHRTKTPTGRV